MERITKRMIDQPGQVGCAHINDAVCIDRSGNCPGCPWEIAAWKRLADYEDTGYTPAGIDAIAEAYTTTRPGGGIRRSRSGGGARWLRPREGGEQRRTRC
jgi:hypothetical protein